MKRILIGLCLLLGMLTAHSQVIRQFQVDTATFAEELTAFTGSSLQSGEVPDFERFLNVFDSLSYPRQLEVIEVSNLMLEKRCRPRPHFIAFQRVLLEFFTADKTFHGYDEWLEGYSLFLKSEEALLRTVDQWLSLSLSLLREEIFYSSNAITWKVSTPDYRFETEEKFRVVFEDVTVACYSGRDFIQIMNASGFIDPVTLIWHGRGGKVTWDRVGIPETELYAMLGDYRINLKTPEYVADSARLYYPEILEGMVLGRLEDKVTQIKSLEQVKYPSFQTYRSTFRIQDVAPGVHYSGGLSVEGLNLVGREVGGIPARLEMFSNDTLRVRAEADRISMNEQFIRSGQSSISIYFGDDSIYHPHLVLAYNVENEQLRLNRSENFKSQGPYYNSYHRIDMSFDELFWNRSEPEMNFQAPLGTSIGRATFESNTFFNFDFYMGLQGMDYQHPLAQLAGYSQMVGGRTFNSGPYSDYVGYPEYQIRHQLMALAKLGFVYYDDQTDLITLREKLFDYLEAAMRARDYDVIRFISRTQGLTNASLNLQSRDLTIRGIPVIFLSDSQNVRLVPDQNQIVMKRNRSFQFDGVVDAGLFRFTGHNFFFQYDSFKIALQDIDSLQLSVFSGEYNQYGEQILEPIDNAIEEMTGELLIDAPDNKSGLASYPQYPTFTSREKSYIYFDSPGIQNGVYDRESFYFELDPFSIDSLDNFRPEAISPSGTFTSAGILPTMRMEMTLREDNSLGFYMETPDEGIDLYGGIGKFYQSIEMSSNGLRAFGNFDYLTSTTWSDDFMMHPDSMMARSRRFLVRERPEAIQYPRVEAEVVDVKLIPADPVMKITRVEETMKMFGDSIFHGGDLALAPGGLTGNGTMAMREARFESDRYTYGARTIAADSAGVQFRGGGMDEFSLLTQDVSLFVDLDARRGDFASTGDQTRIELPYNLYETRLDRLTWFMDRGEVGLSQKKILPENNVDIGIDSLKTNGPRYTSLHPRQDSLTFVAPEAVYDYRNRHLSAFRVPFIEVADAYVFPDSGRVEVGYQAAMGQLRNARVLASQINRRHLIYRASVAIEGAMEYSGTGYYDYRDAFGNSYRIFFEDIWSDTTGVSRAKGNVDEEDRFMLSPFFDFRGEASMTASSPLLTFDGGTRLVHSCDMSRGWMRFTSEIDPENIRIPVGEQAFNMNQNRLFSGSMITRDSTHVYPAFLSSRKDYFDANITRASGTLLYDPDRESYLLAGGEKLADTTRPGDYLRLETDRCRLYGEGEINLNLDYGQVSMRSTGNAVHRIGENQFRVRVILGMNFHFSADALRIMGGEIDSLPDLEPVDLSLHHYQLAMRDLLGAEKARALETDLILTGSYGEIPPELDFTLFFNDLQLAWNQETRSFRHNGKVGIGKIGGIQVNKKVDAYIELVERGSGDTFDMYLKADRNTWYYIAYSPGGLQVLSSNRTFNDLVFNLKASDRRVRAKLGEAQYVYSLAAQRRMELFISRFLEYEDRLNEDSEF